jgi:transcriptional regulator with XRE-family HTH domain
MASSGRPTAEPSWWTSGAFNGRSMREVLRDRDFDAVFGFLGSRGWSRNAIAAATGLSETRVRAVLQGKQRITSYEVLERIADGLMIDRGLVGLAYAGQLDERPTATADGVMEILTPASDVGDRRASAGDARRLRAQDGHQPLRAAPGTGSVHPHAYKVFQLPPDVTDFTGRSKAAAELTTLLTRGPVGNAVVVCVLSGKGGVGMISLSPVGRSDSVSSTEIDACMTRPCWLIWLMRLARAGFAGSGWSGCGRVVSRSTRHRAG